MPKLLFCLWIALLLPGISFSQELVSSELLREYNATQIESLYDVEVEYDVRLIKVVYTTLHPEGVLDTASGLLCLPLADETFPRLIYQHGTVAGPEDVPSRLNTGSVFATIAAAKGFITTAADYIGMGTSKGFHPYVHAATEARAAFDLMDLSTSLLQDENTEATDQLFITGISQGGHAAMACHRYIQNDEDISAYEVTASAPITGPYDLSGATKNDVLGNQNYYFPAYIPHLILGYERVYGNIYSDLDSVFKAPYLNTIRALKNNETGLFDANTSLITKLIQNEGSVLPKLMFRDHYFANIQEDPDFSLNQSLRLNNTYDWSPEVPIRLYYCGADEQVTPLNAMVAEDTLIKNGGEDIEAVNVDGSLGHGECSLPAYRKALMFFKSFLPTANEEIRKDQSPGIKIYPNPAQSKIYISSDTPLDRLSIYDINGQKLKSRKINDRTSVELSMKSMERGFYLLQLHGESGTVRTIPAIRK